MKQQARQKVWITVRIIVSLALLTYLLAQVDPDTLIEAWRNIFIPFLLLAVVLQIFGVAISALKWWLLLRGCGQHVPYLWAVRAYFIGQFFNNFLPTMIGGDAVRVYQLNLRINRPSLAISSVFVERLTGFLALTLIAATSLVLSVEFLKGSPELLLGATWCILIASGGVLLALFASPIAGLLARLRLPNVLNWRGKLQSMSESLAAYYAHRQALALVIVLSFAYQFIWIASNYVLAHALNMDVPFTFMTLMVPISDIIGLVPIFLNNLGAREGTFVIMLGQLGIATELAISLSFLVFVVRMSVSLIGGVLYLLGGLAGSSHHLAKDIQAVQQAQLSRK